MKQISSHRPSSLVTGSLWSAHRGRMLLQWMDSSKRLLHILRRHRHLRCSHLKCHRRRQLDLSIPGHSNRRILLPQLYSPRHLITHNRHRPFFPQQLMSFNSDHRFTHHNINSFHLALAVTHKEYHTCPTCPVCPTCHQPVTMGFLFRARLLQHNSNTIQESFLALSLISDLGHRRTYLNCSQHCTRRLKESRWSQLLRCNTRISSASSRGD